MVEAGFEPSPCGLLPYQLPSVARPPLSSLPLPGLGASMSPLFSKGPGAPAGPFLGQSHRGVEAAWGARRGLQKHGWKE